MSADAIDHGATVRGLAAGQRVFDRFVLARPLGRGGMGVVWLARDEALDRDLALKFLPEIVALDRQALSDLKRETRRALELTHPHIVRVYDFWTDGHHGAIAMEHVAGAPLSALLQSRPRRCFDVFELRDWLGQLCLALGYAHGRARVVHRDLKPGNLLIAESGELKVADFGIAAVISESTRRISNAAAGTPLYMSPQQMMGVAPAVSDDIYALGATLYELLTGTPPFFSGNIVAQVQCSVPVPVATRRAAAGGGPPVPPAWEETIAACLAKDPARRPRTAEEVADRLGVVRKRWTLTAGGGRTAGPATRSAAPVGREMAPLAPAGATGGVSAAGAGAPAGPRGWVFLWWGLGLLSSLPALWYFGLQMPRLLGLEPASNLPAAAVQGLCRITSTPAGAQLVFSDGTGPLQATVTEGGPELRTPVRVLLQSGYCDVEFRLDGYPSTHRLVWVPSTGQEMPLNVNLARSGARAAAGAKRMPTAGAPHRLADLGLVLQWIAPGTFTMGSERLGYGKPLPVVTLSRGYWLGRTEVTQAQWNAVMDGPTSSDAAAAARWGERPVAGVSYLQALEFCRKLSEREWDAGRLPIDHQFTLPSEAQWEYACRAGTKGDFAGAVTAMAWCRATGRGPQAVATRQANAWGLYDMHGNVAEWCRDRYGEYPAGPVMDPRGAEVGDEWVYRGGSAEDTALRCGSANRFSTVAASRMDNLGFRIALVPIR